MSVRQYTDSNPISEFTFFRGRVALYAILKAAELKPGASVALQAFTCVAVPEALLAAGMRPVYIDVIEGGYTMDPADLRRKMTPEVGAIVVQHTFGIPTDVPEMRRIACADNRPFIEDCCHTYLSTVSGQRVGTLGEASFYSFEWGKPIVAGMGGSAVANDGELRKNLKEQYSKRVPPPVHRNLRIERSAPRSLAV